MIYMILAKLLNEVLPWRGMVRSVLYKVGLSGIRRHANGYEAVAEVTARLLAEREPGVGRAGGRHAHGES